MKTIAKYLVAVILLAGSVVVMAEALPCCLELFCCHEQATCCD